MTEYRIARPEEEARLVDFINMVFSMAHCPHDFKTLEPKMYGAPGFAQHHFVAVENGLIRGVVGLMPMTLRVGEKRLKLGYIGSVSAHPYDKGAGHMKHCMALALDAARERGYDLLVLGGQRQRYQYFGFEQGGMSLRFAVNQRNIRHALGHIDETQVTLRPVTDPADPALEKLYALSQRQPLACDRPREKFWAWMHGGVARLIAVEDGQGTVTGYIHARENRMLELGLEDEALLLPVVKAFARPYDEIVVCAQDYQRHRIRLLRGIAENSAVHDSTMLQPLHWATVIEALLQFKAGYQALPAGKRVIAIGEEVLAIEVADGRVSVGPTAAPADLLCAPLEAISRLFFPSEALLEEDPLLRAWLPLPLDLPGADHF